MSSSSPSKRKKKAIPSNKSPTQVLSSKDFSVKLFVSSKCAPLCFNLISPEWMDILTTLAFYLLLSMSYFNYFKIPNIYQKEKKKTIMLSFTYFYQNTLNCSLSVSIIMQKYKDPTQPTQKIGYLYNYIRQVCVDLTWQNPLLSKLLYAIQPTIPQCLKRKAGCLNQLCQNYLFLIQKALI